MRDGIVTGVVSTLLVPLVMSAQGAFEVASVKRNTTGSGGWSISYSADSLHATNATVASLIQSAHGILLDNRLVGGPGWVRTLRFDVNAKAAEALSREKLRLMAQRLLEDRFGVVLTREQRQQEVYELRLARRDGRLGPDLRRAADNCLEIASLPPASQPPRTMPKSSIGAVPSFSGWCASMADVATGLSRSLRFAVVDQTRLSGRFDFVLAYAALAPDAPPGAASGLLDAARDKSTSLPTVFAAVEEQLGLKLERNPRGSVEYTVIASAHAPTED